jgi:hypothetical protein
MELIDTKFVKGEVAERWKASYINNSKLYNGEMSNDIGDKLELAESNDEVNTIIGNDSWTTTACTECHTYQQKVISFAENDYQCVNLCKDCLKAALELIK